MTTPDYSGPERRKFKRVEHYFAVEIQLDDPAMPKVWSTVDLENVSEGGLMFTHVEAHKPGAIFKIRMRVLAAREPIMCLAEIRRVQKLGELELFEYGVCFMDIKETDRDLIRGIVKKSDSVK